MRHGDTSSLNGKIIKLMEDLGRLEDCPREADATGICPEGLEIAKGLPASDGDEVDIVAVWPQKRASESTGSRRPDPDRSCMPPAPEGLVVIHLNVPAIDDPNHDVPWLSM